MSSEIIKMIPAIIVTLLVVTGFFTLPFLLAWISNTNVAGIVAFFLLFITVAVTVSVITSVNSVKWPTVEGTIVENDYIEHKAKTKASLRLSYSYSVRGEEFTNNCRSFSETSHIPSELQPIRDKYPVGAKVNVYYNRSKPAKSVLEPGISKSSLVFSILLAVGTLVAFYFAFKNWQGISPQKIQEIINIFKWKK